MKKSPDVTILLNQLAANDQDVAGRVVPLLYDELHRLAAAYMRHERANHTLQPTALIHEAYLRLANKKDVHWKNRQHFLGVAANVMRRVLVDHARNRHAAKRGGFQPKVSIEEALISSDDHAADLLIFDELLSRLGGVDPQQLRIVELRFFAGLSVEDTANVLGISPATVKRDWSMARAWLKREMQAANVTGPSGTKP